MLKCKAEGAPEVKFSWTRVSVCKAEGAPEVKLSWSRVSVYVKVRVLLKSSCHGPGEVCVVYLWAPLQCIR